MKRTKLADITNTVQFQEKSKDASFGVTNDYISQVIEENAALLKALGERNKIVELSSTELQKYRMVVEKGNQQNRHLALANSQLLAELNLSKERVKALQHELRCTMAVLRLKNSELDEKEKLNKELQEKLTSKVCKCVEDAHDASKVSSVSNNIVPELDEDLEMDNKEKPSKELCEDISTKMDLSSKCVEITTDVSIPHSHSTSIYSPTRRRTLRSRSSTSLINQVQEKKNELHEKIKDEDVASRNVEKATDVQQVPSVSNKGKEKLDRKLHNTSEDQHESVKGVASAASEAQSVDISMASKQNRKRSLRNQTSCSANLAHQVEEGKEKDARIRRKSSRISSNIEEEPYESKDHLFEMVDADIPGCCSFQPLIEENPIHKADGTKDQTLESRRSSVGGRPSRRAAEKVTSYKEIPLKVKMRRSE